MCSVLAAVAVFLFGSVGAAAQSDLSSIKKIAIDSEISQPEIPFIQGPGHFKAFMVGGGMGAAIDQQEAGKAFREYMRKNDIEVSKIVLESFRRAIEEDKTFTLGEAADAKLRLAVNSYGFGVAGFFGGDERRPMMNVTAALVSSGGDVLWKKTVYITNLSKQTDAHTYDQLATDPQLTVKSFEQVSVLVSRQVLAEMRH
jgi:hypothetical protein